MSTDKFNEAYALEQDAKAGEFHGCRERFNIPPVDPRATADSEISSYLCGNSLGVQPKDTVTAIERHMKDWSSLGVCGHFDDENALCPWTKCELNPGKLAAELVGALEDEVCICNTLSLNLHLLMVSFYLPEGRRNKILLEDHAFCSDSHVVMSQVKLHGLDPEECVVRVVPRDGEFTIRTEDVLAKIAELGDTLCVALLPGVQYYTGQKWDIAPMVKAVHEVGAICGVDLAHAMGNTEVRLHDWDVDFAAWCHYKYVNAGPGAIAGLFLHQRHFNNTRPRLTGWWGQTLATRFAMRDDWNGEAGARSYQLSNPPVLSMVAVEQGLLQFTRVGMSTLIERSRKLTNYLDDMISHYIPDATIITPRNADQRGCQISLLLPNGFDVERLEDDLAKNGVIIDARKPNVIRIAPTPLYNNHHDIYRAVSILRKLMDEQSTQH